MNELNFIKGKWIITKSVDDFTISAYFETSVRLYEVLHKYLNDILQLQITVWTEVYTYNCKIDTSVKNYIIFAEDHWVLRLDIILWNDTNVMLMWIIVLWELKLLLPKK